MHDPLLSPVLAQTGNDAPAPIFVSAFFLLFLLLGLLKCYRIARRPRTHPLCVLALALVLVGWAIGIVSLLITAYVGPAAGMLLSILGFLLFLTAPILGGLALLDLSRNRERYDQGRSQARWALGLGILMLLIPAIGIVSVISKRQSGEAFVASGHRPAEIRREDLNLVFSDPGSPWVPLDVTKLSTDACLGFLRQNPTISFMLVGESVGVEVGTTTESLAQITSARILANGTGATTTPPAREELAGIPGLRYSAEMVVGRNPIYYSFWVAAHHGYLYQHITYGPRTAWAEIESQARLLGANFRVIDPSRLAHAAGAGGDPELNAPYLGVSVNLENLGWRAWSDADEDIPEAFFAALRGSDMALCMVALPPLLPEPPLDAVVSAFLGILDMRPEEMREVHPHDQGGAQGRAFEVRRRAGEDSLLFRYRLRVLQGRGHSYLLAGWTLDDPSSDIKALDKALDRFRFSPVDPRVDAPPLTPGQREGRAAIHNDLGLAALQANRTDEAEARFRDATTLDPHKGAHLTNLLRVLVDARRIDEAISVLEQHIDLFPEDLEVLSWRPFLLTRTENQREQAVPLYEDLFSAGHRDEGDLLDFVRLLVDLERPEEAITALDGFHEASPSRKAQLWKIELLSASERHDEAIALAERLRQKDPQDLDLGLAHVTALGEADRASDAVELCRTLIEGGMQSAGLYRAKASNEANLGWYPDAKASLERALELEPGNESFASFLRDVSAELGQGNNSSIKTRIEPVSMPDELVALLKGGGEAAPDGVAAVFEHDVLGVHYEKGKSLRWTEHGRIKILNQTGVSHFGTLEFGFDPLAESIFLDHAVIEDSTGRKVAEVRVNDLWVKDDASLSWAAHDQVLVVPVPGLRPGLVLDYAVTREERSPAGELPLQKRVLAGGYPTRLAALFLTGDVGGLAHRSSKEVQSREGERLLVLYRQDPPTFRNEPLPVPVEEFLPMAWVADASATWDSLARSYRERIGERLAPAAVARQLADRLTADIDDPELRLRAIAEHVQSELSYQAIEFGRRAWLPDSFDTVVKNRFGDCKAHALFLHQLLTAGGFDAHLALVSTWSPVREDLPSLEAFDHMIVYVGGSSVDSGLQVARFLDATDKNTDALAAVPYGLAEAPALILDLESPRLVKIPGYPEDAAAVRTRATGHIERVKGSPLLRIVETVELAGLRSAGLRGMLRGVEATDLHNRLQGILFAHGNLVLTRARAENLEDPAAPLILHLEYDAPDAVVELDGRLLVSLPAPWEKDSLEVSPVEDRRSPFRIRSPLQVHRRFVLTLPEGHRSLSEEVRDRLTSHPYYKGEKILRKNEGTVQVETEVQFLPGRFESEHYADYCTGIRSLLSSLQHREILAPVN